MFSSFDTLTLRGRFALGLSLVLLPFVVAAVAGELYIFPQLTAAFDEMVGESRKMEPITNAQIVLPMAGMPANDYLITGDEVERKRFAELSREVDQAFDVLLATPFSLEREHKLVRLAQGEWRQARDMGKLLLQASNPIGNRQLALNMKVMDAHIDHPVKLLDEVHGLSHQQVTDAESLVSLTKRYAFLVIVMSFITALVISLAVGLLLSRSLIRAIDVLVAATQRLSRGDFSTRVALDPRWSEIAQLGQAFNGMAETIGRQRQTLEDLAIQDSLTGLYNRRGFHMQMEEELARSQRHGHVCALLMLDVDRFKNVNDTHGHQAGDEVLRVIAVRIRDQMRPMDRVARYGGEEFVAILAETDAADAMSVAERVRRAVADQPIQLATEVSLTVTISIGVAVFPSDADNEAGLIAAADRALYVAKQSGRNRALAYGGLDV